MPQSLARIALHIVFSTKERRSLLRNPTLAAELPAYLGAVLKNLESPMVAVGIVEDHIHILCMLSKNIAPMELIKECKRTTSVWVKERCPDLYDFHWQNGYGVFSVSVSNIEKVKGYIQAQAEHHRQFSFQDELRALLKKHAVEYDERYLWE